MRSVSFSVSVIYYVAALFLELKGLICFGIVQCAAKKCPPKFFCHLLSNRSEFLREIFKHLLLIHNHVTTPSSNVLFLIMTKLYDQVVISDVHGMFAERKTHHIL